MLRGCMSSPLDVKSYWVEKDKNPLSPTLMYSEPCPPPPQEEEEKEEEEENVVVT